MPVALPDLPQAETVIVEMTNAFRAESHLGGVVPNAILKAAAQAYANYLAQTGAFAHTADGRQPADRAAAAGYHYCMVAENLALNQTNRGFETLDLAQRTIEGWKNSPPHRASMLNPHVTEIGVGIAKASDRDPKFLTVQLFGRPDSMKYNVSIQNTSGTTVAYRFGETKTSISTAMSVTHTACLPADLAFDIGKVTSKFEARDGVVFSITRGQDGGLRVNQEATRQAAGVEGGHGKVLKSPH